MPSHICICKPRGRERLNSIQVIHFVISAYLLGPPMMYYGVRRAEHAKEES